MGVRAYSLMCLPARPKYHFGIVLFLWLGLATTQIFTKDNKVSNFCFLIQGLLVCKLCCCIIVHEYCFQNTSTFFGAHKKSCTFASVSIDFEGPLKFFKLVCFPSSSIFKVIVFNHSSSVLSISFILLLSFTNLSKFSQRSHLLGYINDKIISPEWPQTAYRTPEGVL